MRHSSFTAFYDANVLYPAPLRDFLMYVASKNKKGTDTFGVSPSCF